MIIDSHAHYDDEAFEEDRDNLLQSMQSNGIEKIINVGANIKGSRASIALSEQYPFIYAAVGVHPSDTEELNEEKMAWLKEVSKKEKVVAIGEIGLDYYWPEPDREIQKKWFIRQMELAQEVNLPVIIHSRDAAQDTIEILKQFPANGVIHCYSYTKESAKEFLKMGYYFGIGGVLTFKNARVIKEVASEIPLSSIVLETDSPYLAPVPYRGKRNNSMYLKEVVKQLAQIKQVSEEIVITTTLANAKRLYRLEENCG